MLASSANTRKFATIAVLPGTEKRRHHAGERQRAQHAGA